MDPNNQSRLIECQKHKFGLPAASSDLSMARNGQPINDGVVDTSVQPGTHSHYCISRQKKKKAGWDHRTAAIFVLAKGRRKEKDGTESGITKTKAASIKVVMMGGGRDHDVDGCSGRGDVNMSFLLLLACGHVYSVSRATNTRGVSLGLGATSCSCPLLIQLLSPPLSPVPTLPWSSSSSSSCSLLHARRCSSTF